MPVEVNYLAVLAATIAAFIVGGLWYSPVGFGKQWMKLQGKDPSSMQGMSFPMGLMVQEFIATLVMAFVISQFAAWLGVVGIEAGLLLGFWLWLGFVATTMYGAVLWQSEPIGLYFLNVSLRFINILLMAAIIGVWR